MQRLTKISPARHALPLCCLALLCAPLAACSKSERANEVTLARVCNKAAIETIAPKTLRQLEMRFFADKRARDLLSVERIKLKSMREVRSSATIGAYELTFDFLSAQGDVLVLRNVESTGGVSLEGPNQVMFKGVCEVQWSHFKGRPLQKTFSIQTISLDSLDSQLRALDVD
jgi:hypothetical protein